MKTLQKKKIDIFGTRYRQRLASLGKPFAKESEILLRAHDAWQPDLGAPSIAIVGTRRPTSYGLRFVSTFVETLGNISGQKPVVISGGALGIDAWAHEAALRVGLPTESWVVGPIRAPNPRSHRPLFEAIVREGGALLCPASLEPASGAQPYRTDWVLRNAYLVARADVVLVPEANEKSGTWSSVRWANRLSIPVFALPGPVDRASSSGTNLMISSGYAHPVESATKLMEDFVVEGFLNPYNKRRERGPVLELLEQKLCSPEGLDLADLPGLAEQMGLELDELCKYLWEQVRLGKLRRLGNGFERRG